VQLAPFQRLINEGRVMVGTARAIEHKAAKLVTEIGLNVMRGLRQHHRCSAGSSTAGHEGKIHSNSFGCLYVYKITVYPYTCQSSDTPHVYTHENVDLTGREWTAMDDLWLNIGAMVAGLFLMVGWHYAANAREYNARRGWTIVKFASLGYLIFWLIVMLPTLISVFTDGV
jgi:hypothetical protein